MNAVSVLLYCMCRLS